MMTRQMTRTFGRVVDAVIYARPPGWAKPVRRIGFGAAATIVLPAFVCLAFVFLAFAGTASRVLAADGERFEVTSIKAVRPTLADTVAALQQRDVARAKAAFEAYDSAWNGIEVYINARSKELYDVLELNYQRKIAKALDAANPDTAALLADAQVMLAKYDEAIGLVTKAAPLNPLYDDIARLRIVRAHLREVIPAIKAGDVAKARKSFEAFDDAWDSIEDLIKARSDDNYVAIEKGMIEIEQALMPDKPDPAKVTALVNEVMAKYNASLAEVVKEARSRP
jgi:tetratricopeptide (TPR) repeat protein